MPQNRQLKTDAEPGDVIRVYIKTEAGTRDYAYEVDEAGLVNWTGQGFRFADSDRVSEGDPTPQSHNDIGKE